MLVSVLLLAVPVEVVVRLGYGEIRKVRLRWMFGLIDVGTGWGAARLGRRGNNRFLAMLRTDGFLERIIQFAREVFPLVKVRTLKIDLSIGGDDYAETGMLFGMLVPAVVFARSRYGLDLNLEADFESPRSDARVVGIFSAHPIRLIKPLLWFVFSPCTIRAIRAAGRT